ncbi:MAG TPA: hypothetical protein VHV30_11970 [Polyangiaceae bacterium]|jgi:hypothetical protein|nr:hypothetical protein [Polyangiaceae bacterium]
MTARTLALAPIALACAVVCALWTRAARAECVETGPSGGERPTMVDAFPERGLSGYAATLHIVVSHGKGETVLPRGLELQSESDAARALKSAGFAIPDQDGGGAARLSSTDLPPDAKGVSRRQTTLDLPLVALPSGPGRHTLVLPPMPVSVARASSDVVTLCTKEHTIIVEDPTSSTPDAKPHGNPPPRIQREEWTALEHGLAWVFFGAAAGAVVAWIVFRWMRRPKPVPPPPPPRVPWEVAFERLHEARHAGLLEMQRFSDFYDRVNDAVREYLGARFGFDGLESTTDETLAALRKAPHVGLPLPEVAGFLQQCDLVKFATLTPTLEECEHALGAAEKMVRATMPALREPPARTDRASMRPERAQGDPPP